MAGIRFRFDRVAIAPSSRTALVALVDCLGVTLEQEDRVNDAKVWDDAASGTHKVLPAGAELACFQDRPGRFNVGETICWVEAVAGTGPVLVHYRQ